MQQVAYCIVEYKMLQSVIIMELASDGYSNLER